MAGEASGLVGGWVKGFTQTEMTNSKSITLNLVVNKLCHIQERMEHLGIEREERQEKGKMWTCEKMVEKETTNQNAFCLVVGKMNVCLAIQHPIILWIQDKFLLHGRWWRRYTYSLSSLPDTSPPVFKL